MNSNTLPRMSREMFKEVQKRLETKLGKSNRTSRTLLKKQQKMLRDSLRMLLRKSLREPLK